MPKILLIILVSAILFSCSERVAVKGKHSENDSLPKGQMNLDSLIQVSIEESEKRKQDAIGKPYPAFFIKNETGLLSNKDLYGKIIFVNFWFATCPPCIEEFDAINQLYFKFKGKQFEIVSFTFENEKKVKEIRKKYNLKYKIFSITKEECERLNFGMGYPTNIILDEKGIIKNLFTGGPDSGTVEEFFKKQVYPAIVMQTSI